MARWSRAITRNGAAQQATFPVDVLDRHLDAAKNRATRLGAVRRQVGIKPDQQGLATARSYFRVLHGVAQLICLGQQVIADLEAELVGYRRQHRAEALTLLGGQGMNLHPGGADRLDELGFAAGGFLAFPDGKLARGAQDDVAHVRRQRLEDPLAGREYVAQIGVIAQCQVFLHRMKAHADDGDERIFLAIDRAFGKCLVGGMEVDRDSLGAE